MQSKKLQFCAGKISRSGRIIPDKEYWQNVRRKDQQRYAEECLAQATFQKILDMERYHELEMKRKLENSVKKVRVQKIKASSCKQKHHTLEPDQQFASGVRLDFVLKGERSELTLMNSVEYVTGISPYQLPVINRMIPVPPPALQKGDKSVNAVRAVRTRMLRGRLFHPTTAANDRGQLLPKTSWLPNTAPGNTLQPLLLPPVCISAAIGSAPKASSCKQKHHTLEPDQQFASGVRLDFILEGERSELTLMNSVEYVTGISPYQLPVINHMIPVPPPALQKGDKSVNAVRAVRTRMLRGRLFHPTTAANDRGQLLPKDCVVKKKSHHCSK
ncbi:glutamate-rich protein 3-like [Phaenicophaeus curvirostris]|uniref:glutamate-rich protein 3-like n=1 Tax=Phaenicophaeus curvirostris TaxID=33595 RepID=UPI0037F0CB28